DLLIPRITFRKLKGKPYIVQREKEGICFNKQLLSLPLQALTFCVFQSVVVYGGIADNLRKRIVEKHFPTAKTLEKTISHLYQNLIYTMKEIISNLRDLIIGIVGCGWLGTIMAEKWQRNNLLYTTTTSPQKLPVLEAQGFHPFCIDFNSSRVEEVSRWDVMEKLDVLIITVPISSRKDRSLQNIEQRIRNLTLFLGRFEGQLFFMDSTSIYPAEKREFTEDDVSVEEVAAERLLRKSYPEVNIL